MYLGYFIISALEALDVLDESMTDGERSDYINWIYHCQHPQGGFRMWPGTDFGDRANGDNARWDPAHVPATYFALTTLLALRDDLTRVKLKLTRQWLRSMQRADGSFGETRVNGHIEGGNDPRFGYCAAGCRFILQSLGQTSADDDIDVIRLAASVVRGQSYDGGIADTAYHEPHAGYTFCALGALALIGRLQGNGGNGELDVRAVTRWLAERQTDLVDPDAMLDPEFVGKAAITTETRASSELVADGAHPGASPDKSSPTVIQAGMNGRINKVADTCYCWWVSASLEMLGSGDVYDKSALRRYLLGLTQNEFMGGFNKFPDDKYADIYHSYMGLIALSLCSSADERRVAGIKEWDATMCISADVRRRVTLTRQRAAD